MPFHCRKKTLERLAILGDDIFSKSNEKSTRYRMAGNEFFKKEQYSDALREYTKVGSACLWCPC